MPLRPLTARSLRSENRQLRQQLEEAQDLLRAIRHGEIDALTGSRGLEGRVFTRAGAETPYRLLVEAMNEGAVTIGADQTVLYANKRFASLVQMPLEHIVGGSFRRFLRSEDQQHSNVLIERGWQVSQQTEICLLTRNGAEVPVYLSVQPLPATEGQVSIVVTDISKLKHVEAQLRAGHARLHHLLTSSPAVVYTCEAAPPFRPTFVSDNATVSLGYAPHEFAEEPDLWRQKLHPDDAPRVLRELPRVLERGSHVHEYRFLHKDGTYRWLHDQLRLVTHQGQEVEIVGCCFDVTERRRAEESARSAQERLRAVVTNIPVVLWSIDSGGTFTLFEGKGLESLRVHRGEVVGRAVWDLYGDAPAVLENCRRALSGETFSAVVPVQDLLFDAWYSPLRGADDAIIGAIGVKIDVTNRKQLEEQLRQAQKMEAVGRLAGGVAHDFNNLLTAIQGYSDLLAEALGPASQHLGDLDEIRKAAESAAGLTRQLLAFSRKQILQPAVLDLNAVIQDTLKLLARVLGEDIEIVTHYAPELGPVMADPAQVQQVLMNLAVNARDAMPKGGRLEIETANVEVKKALVLRGAPVPSGRYVSLTVRDTGTGMTPEVMAHLFEPFFTTKERGKGTGLGLSTVYGIVKQSGGYIWGPDEPFCGATFTIYFPYHTVDSSVKMAVAAQPVSCTGTETLLVVEDNDSVRDLSQRMLRRYGYTVLLARDGNEALAVCDNTEKPIDLLLTDIVMPGISGRTLADRVRERWPRIKIVFTSGYTDDALVHHGVLDARIAFVSKPFTPEALARKIRQTLDAP